MKLYDPDFENYDDSESEEICEQEYNFWLDTVEREYIEECKNRGIIDATKFPSNFVLHHTEEELSPFSTINS